MIEIFRDIKEYERLYQISNLGRVKSLERERKFGWSYRIIKEKILKGRPDKDGYLRVNLSKNNISKDFKIHRLVAIHFIDNPENKPAINHIDGNKNNNMNNNLEWVTNKENSIHSVKIGLHNCGKKKIICVSNGKLYNSCKEASELLNLSRTGISAVLKNKIKSTKGFAFIYAQ